MEYYLLFYNGALMAQLLNDPLASCSSLNLYLFLPQTSHFDDSIVLPFLVFDTFKSMFSVFLLHFKQYDAMFYDSLIILHLKM